MSNNAIVDAGEKLGGAVKDDWANYQRKAEDAAKASVADLWPRPDWEELIAQIAVNPEHAGESARACGRALLSPRDGH